MKSLSMSVSFFQRLRASPDRAPSVQLHCLSSGNLLVTALSAYEGAHFTETFAQDLARSLAGVALVALLDEECSRHLTKQRGMEWSAGSGAVCL